MFIFRSDRAYNFLIRDMFVFNLKYFVFCDQQTAPCKLAIICRYILENALVIDAPLDV